MVPAYHRQSRDGGRLRITVNANTVARLLGQMGYSLRVNQKQLATDASPDFSAQFLYISDLRDRFQGQGLPINSVDTKKRELVSNFKNPGARSDHAPRAVSDHDFRSDAIGVAIPHGVYDLLANRDCVTVGVSHDTRAFAARAIARWWQHDGGVRYPRAKQDHRAQAGQHLSGGFLPPFERRDPGGDTRASPAGHIKNPSVCRSSAGLDGVLEEVLQIVGEVVGD